MLLFSLRILAQNSFVVVLAPIRVRLGRPIAGDVGIQTAVA